MEKVKLKCYLCGGEAEKSDDPFNPRDELVECKGDCVNRYKVTSEALRFYLDWEREKPLTDEDRFELSSYVYKQVVPITTDVIKEVTKKESVGYR